jgi:hypothetical protein
MPDERYNGRGPRCESDQQGPSETLSNINFSLPEPDTSPRKVVLRQCSLQISERSGSGMLREPSQSHGQKPWLLQQIVFLLQFAS